MQYLFIGLTTGKLFFLKRKSMDQKVSSPDLEVPDRREQRPRADRLRVAVSTQGNNKVHDLRENPRSGSVDNWELGQNDKALGAEELQRQPLFPDNHRARGLCHLHGLHPEGQLARHFFHRQNHANLEVSPTSLSGSTRRESCCCTHGSFLCKLCVISPRLTLL